MVPWIRKIVNPPAIDDEVEANRRRVLNFLLLVALPMTVIMGIAVGIIAPKSTTILWIVLTLFLGELVTLFLTRVGLYKLASQLFVFGLAIHVILVSILAGGVSRAGYSAYLVVIVLGGILLGMRPLIFLVAAGITAGFGMFWAEANGYLSSDPPIQAGFYWAAASMIFIWSAAALYAAIFNIDRAIERMRLEITEKLQTQAENDRLAAVVKQTSESVMITNLNGEIVYVNPSFEHLTGYHAEEVLEHDPRFLQNSHQDEKFYAGLWDTIQSGDTWRNTIINRQKDGSIYHLDATIFPIKDASGKITNYAEIGRDITDRVKDEETLRRQLQELAVLHAIATASAETLGEDALIECATQIIGQSFYSDNFGILLLDEDAGVLQPHPSYQGIDHSEKLKTQPATAGIAGEVVQSGVSMRIADVTRYPVYIGITPGMRSELCVPLKIGERMLGVINAESADLDAFTEADERLLTTVAGQLATAIEKARLFAVKEKARLRLEEYTSRLEFLRQIDHSILASQQPEEIARATLSHLRKLVPCHRASVTLFDFEADIATILAVDLEGETSLGLGKSLPLRQSFPGIDLLQQNQCSVMPDLQDQSDLSTATRTLRDEAVRSIVNLPLISNGQLVGSLNLGSSHPDGFNPDQIEIARDLANSLTIALQNARLLQESQRQANQLAGLYETALATSSQLEIPALLDRLYPQIKALINPDTFLITLHHPETHEIQIARVVEEGKILQEYENVRIPLDEAGLTGWVVSQRQALLVGDLLNDPLPVEPKHGSRPARSWLGVPLSARDRLVGTISVQSFSPNVFNQDHRLFLESMASQVAIVLENARLFEAERRRTRELAALADISAALRTAQSRTDILAEVLDMVLACFEADGAALIACLQENDRVMIEQGRGVWQSLTGQVWTPALEGSSQALAVNRSNGRGDRQSLTSSSPLLDKFEGKSQTVSVPMVAQGETIGRLVVGRKVSFGDADTRLLSAIADIAANAIQRAALHEQTRRRLSQVQALHAIDNAITSSADLRLVLKVVMEQVKAQLKVDAATVLLLSPHTQLLEASARMGFHTGALRHTHLQLGESFAGRAALERRIIHIPDLSAESGEFKRSELFGWEGFTSYYAAPLITKGQVKGVLELFHRHRYEPEKEWHDFLVTIATQAAIAIENAELFYNLQHSNQELALAYDTTLEGWSKALELRDQETEGHTKRVTDMTLRLARDLGIPDAEMVHVRRGALLHDIGKMGIPDSILLKPEPLNEAEWDIMRLHPVYADKLLSPIHFLRQARDIPYCHHEKWDGSGYPQGLSGNQIPLAARIFAIVDVWDALNSDRPYRSAWPREKVLEYIHTQSGTHFDPQVARVFLNSIEAS